MPAHRTVSVPDPLDFSHPASDVREDLHTTTVDAAAARARLRTIDDPHPLDCRCPGCARDELGPEDWR